MSAAGSFEFEKLDNPAWHSLSETHHSFAINRDHIKFYQPDYCPFGGSDGATNVSKDIGAYSLFTGNFFVIGEKPTVPASLQMKNELVCLQMIINNKIAVAAKYPIIRLKEEHQPALFNLVNQVQPGYFRQKTFLLGDYFGIFKDDVLVAASGERMKMNRFTEISAIVTHPAHTGNGYASQLIAHCVNNVYDQNKIPYLHVAEINSNAIRLYEKLGFVTRRKISFWNITAAPQKR